MPKFVIHHHFSKREHYDLRLEIDNVLKSWAVPKEPNDKEKRLAIMVDDHPLEYGNFEGIIKEGYGKGTVEIWDSGNYENLKQEPMKNCLKNGAIEINIKGKKLKGHYALIKTNFKNKNSWLFFKMKK